MVFGGVWWCLVVTLVVCDHNNYICKCVFIHTSLSIYLRVDAFDCLRGGGHSDVRKAWHCAQKIVPGISRMLLAAVTSLVHWGVVRTSTVWQLVSFYDVYMMCVYTHTCIYIWSRPYVWLKVSLIYMYIIYITVRSMLLICVL